MWNFAWRNLLTRPLRTTLALVGLSIPILGVLGLFSLSGGLRNLVGDTLSQIQGVMVLRENAISPVLSDLPIALRERIEGIPGVRVVAPEIFKIAPEIEGQGLFVRTVGGLVRGSKESSFQGLIDQPIIIGQDLATHTRLKSAVYPSKMVPPGQGGGRFLNVSDRGRLNAVVSRKIAADYPISEGGRKRPRRVGDPIKIGKKSFTIVGLYDTGSMFLDVAVLMDIETARTLTGFARDSVSAFYVEADDPSRIEEVAAAIEAAIAEPIVDARSMSEFSSNFGQLMGHLDTFLLMTVSLAMVVGVVGIVNTMLMSTTERFGEFGVLRTNGWSKGNVLTLVTAESAYLGLLSGAVGCVLAVVGTTIANQFLGGGLRLVVSPWLLGLGLGLSVVMGTLGGLVPAWRAAQLVPMDAIRVGAR